MKLGSGLELEAFCLIRHGIGLPSPHQRRFCPHGGLLPIHLSADYEHISKDWFRLMEMVLSELVLVAFLLAVVVMSGRV